MNDHSSLHRAKANKEDEFYTKWGDGGVDISPIGDLNIILMSS